METTVSTQRGRHKEMEAQVGQSILTSFTALLALALAAPTVVAQGERDCKAMSLSETAEYAERRWGQAL